MRSLLAVFAALLIVIGSVDGGFAAPMPWDTFSNGDRNMVKDTIRSDVQPCPAGEVYIAVAVVGEREHPSASYIMVYAPSTGIIVFAYDPNPNNLNAPPTELGVGKMDPEKSDVIPALTWHSYTGDPADHPCRLLFPETL